MQKNKKAIVFRYTANMLVCCRNTAEHPK